ncbi:hypothetical protein WOLCODRAFT_144333 [Wolfiporia cocos MD-104 SS10]|uniref:DUF6535 domain-containing protein n=1 Tax=Wolfiporia cocos (strain MD-104) TaxID=742152 RepID=A0A2H3K1W2_WOLCO|nr:hypothetical protein WOLCODRAFT_144333 [Wolfiporia cocos MD-104 SS10]
MYRCLGHSSSNDHNKTRVGQLLYKTQQTSTSGGHHFTTPAFSPLGLARIERPSSIWTSPIAVASSGTWDRWRAEFHQQFRRRSRQQTERSAVNCKMHNGTNLPLNASHREGQGGSPRAAAHSSFSNGCTCLQDERLLPICDHLVLPQRHELKTDLTKDSNNAKFQAQDRPQGTIKPMRNTGEVVASSQLVWDHERRRVERRKDEIDNLLVFAALFSAVLTSFAVNSYQMLQPQSSNQSSQVLPHVSQILGALVLNSGSINSTSPELLRLLQADITSATQTVALSAIVINGLWFSSLVCSLAAASVGITIRQWLNHHDDIPIGFDAQDNVRVWHLRRDGYDGWHVTGLLIFYPYCSTSLCNPPLHAVADAIMAQIALLGVFLIFTTIAPVFRQNCPYRSPQSLWMLQLAQSMWFVLYRSIGRPAGLRLWVQAIHQWPSRWHVGYTASWRIYEQQVMVSCGQSCKTPRMLRRGSGLSSLSWSTEQTELMEAQVWSGLSATTAMRAPS